MSLLLLFGNLGCKTCDLVEAELRYQTNRVEKLENELLLKESEIHTLQGTIDGLRHEIDERGSGAPPEAIYKNIGLAKLTLGTLTGGRDLDKDGRADALQVAIEPHDYDGDILKCPGTATIDLYQLQPSGVKKNIGRWEADSEQLRQNWRATMLGQGYQLVLPWQYQPTRENLRVVVQFTTVDGRTFEAERDFQLSGPVGSLPNARPVPAPIAEPPASTAPAGPSPDPPAPPTQPFFDAPAEPPPPASPGPEPQTLRLGRPIPQENDKGQAGPKKALWAPEPAPHDLAGPVRATSDSDRTVSARPMPRGPGIQTRWQTRRDVAYVSPAVARKQDGSSDETAARDVFSRGAKKLASSDGDLSLASRLGNNPYAVDEEIVLPLPGQASGAEFSESIPHPVRPVAHFELDPDSVSKNTNAGPVKVPAFSLPRIFPARAARESTGDAKVEPRPLRVSSNVATGAMFFVPPTFAPEDRIK